MLWWWHRSAAFHSSRLGGDFCILCHTSLVLSLHAGLTLRPRDPDAASVASNLLWAFPMTASPQKKLWYSKTRERANFLSSSVWIKHVLQSYLPSIIWLEHSIMHGSAIPFLHLCFNGRRCSRLICSAQLLSSYIKI